MADDLKIVIDPGKEKFKQLQNLVDTSIAHLGQLMNKAEQTGRKIDSQFDKATKSVKKFENQTRRVSGGIQTNIPRKTSRAMDAAMTKRNTLERRTEAAMGSMREYRKKVFAEARKPVDDYFKKWEKSIDKTTKEYRELYETIKRVNREIAKMTYGPSDKMDRNRFNNLVRQRGAAEDAIRRGGFGPRYDADLASEQNKKIKPIPNVWAGEGRAAVNSDQAIRTAYQQSIDEYRKQSKSETKATKDIRRKSRLLNTVFGDISIGMSGLAASMFVFQNIIQGIKGLVNWLGKLDKAVATITTGQNATAYSDLEAKAFIKNAYMQTGAFGTSQGQIADIVELARHSNIRNINVKDIVDIVGIADHPSMGGDIEHAFRMWAGRSPDRQTLLEYSKKRNQQIQGKLAITGRGLGEFFRNSWSMYGLGVGSAMSPGDIRMKETPVQKSYRKMRELFATTSLQLTPEALLGKRKRELLSLYSKETGFYPNELYRRDEEDIRSQQSKLAELLTPEKAKAFADMRLRGINRKRTVGMFRERYDMSIGLQKRLEKEVKAGAPMQDRLYDFLSGEIAAKHGLVEYGSDKIKPHTAASYTEQIKFDQKYRESRLTADKEMFDRVGQMTNDLYVHRRKTIDETAGLYKKLGMSQVEAEEVATKKILELNVERAVGAKKYVGGMMQAIEEYRKTASNGAAQMNNIWTDALSGIENALVNMAKTGKLSFSSLIDAMIADLARLAVQQKITGPLSQLLSRFFGASLGGYNTNLSAMAPSNSGMMGGATLNVPTLKNGGVFGPNGIMPFAKGGLVNSPTLFKFARGTGLMGEAGPEAIMPLGRTPSGELGVKGGTPNIDINIVNQSGQNVGVQQQGKPKFNGRKVSIDLVMTALDSKTVQNRIQGIR